MAQLLCNGAQLMCSFGMAPSTLMVLPDDLVNISEQPVASIEDSQPMVNIPPFGMCMSLANPEVASATSAAMGALTPMPCIPATAAPWTPGVPTVMVGGAPATDLSCTCMCTWGGEITVVSPGQVTVSSG